MLYFNQLNVQDSRLMVLQVDAGFGSAASRTATS